jgi:SAM-dependent methyltransferase
MTEQEQPQNTYFLDPESATEMARLIEQDRAMTKAMGGALSHLPKLSIRAQILDVACGPGGWVLDAAYALPLGAVSGVDISRIMIEYANARARSQGLTNVSFGLMDITQPLDFSDRSFDLVNARTLLGVLRRGAWPPFIAECSRILKPGGILRLTEPVDIGVTNSASTERLLDALKETLWKANYGFSANGRAFALLPALPALLRDAGYQNVHTNAFTMEFSADTPDWIDFYRNYQAVFLQSKPGCLKVGAITGEEFDTAYQQVLIDMNQPDFRGMATFVNVIGTKAL